MSLPAAKAERIRQLNDIVRQNLMGGQIILTAGVRALPAATQAEILSGVRAFSDYSENNDPHAEHDFGAITVDGHQVFWKFEYYDKSLQFGSEDPSDTAITTRVLTIMLASEY